MRRALLSATCSDETFGSWEWSFAVMDCLAMETIFLLYSVQINSNACREKHQDLVNADLDYYGLEELVIVQY